MKIGIIYAGKTGTTEYCAGILSKALDASLINLEADNGNLNDYDIIIIGSSIRMGMVHPKIKRFLKKYKNLIQEKNFAIFVCQGLPETFTKVMSQNFTESIRNDALVMKTFGGVLILEKQKGLAKLMTKALMKNPNFIAPTIDHQEIAEFVRLIKKFIDKGDE
ncbi:MAG: flavodoxin domain-containing protein [Bacilli bacterium]